MRTCKADDIPLFNQHACNFPSHFDQPMLYVADFSLERLQEVVCLRANGMDVRKHEELLPCQMLLKQVGKCSDGLVFVRIDPFG